MFLYVKFGGQPSLPHFYYISPLFDKSKGKNTGETSR